MRHRPDFIRFLCAEGLLSEEDAAELAPATSKAKALFGQLLLRRKILTLREMIRLLEKQAAGSSKRLGELAVEAGHLTLEALDALVVEQSVAGAMHPIDALRRRELLSQDTLMEALVAYVKRVDDEA